MKKHLSGKLCRTGTKTVTRPTAVRRSTTHNSYTKDTQLTHKIQQSAYRLPQDLKGTI